MMMMMMMMMMTKMMKKIWKDRRPIATPVGIYGDAALDVERIESLNKFTAGSGGKRSNLTWMRTMCAITFFSVFSCDVVTL